MNLSKGAKQQSGKQISKTLVLTIVFVLLVIVVVLILTKFLPFSLESMSQLSLIVNLVTLLTLFRYAYDTYRMADQQQAINLTPIISHGFSESEWTHADGDIKLFLKNYSPFDVRISLWADIYFDGQLLSYQSELDQLAYQGKAKWVMCAKEGAYQGRIKFGKHLLEHNNINSDISSAPEREKHKILIKLRYEASNNICEQIYKSEIYAYRLQILKHPYYNETAHEYKMKEMISLIPMVEE